MKKIDGRGRPRWPDVCRVVLALAATCSWAEIAPPLYVGNLEPVRGPYGRPMAGGNFSSGEVGPSLVEIRVAPYGGQRFAPKTTGGADPRNRLVTTNSFGEVGMNALRSDSGLFCLVFPERLPTEEMIFARAYNASTAAKASFYADSYPVRVPTQTTASSIVLVFEPAKMLDENDDDKDGLSNSWEKLLGTDGPDAIAIDDYDGDGMSDLHEMLAGTCATNPGSLLALRSIRPGATKTSAAAGGRSVKPVRVRWQSVPGMKYQLQFVSTLLDEQEFIPVLAEDGTDFLTADEDEYEIEMSVDLTENMAAGFFRVKLVQE